MTSKANEECVRAHLAAANAHDMDGALETMHPECVVIDEPLGLRLEGREGARQRYETWWSAFASKVEQSGRSGMHWVEDDLLIGDGAFVGEHVGPFAGIEPTGRPMRLPFVIFMNFTDGLVSGERYVYDLNGLVRQLGQRAFVPNPRNRRVITVPAH